MNDCGAKMPKIDINILSPTDVENMSLEEVFSLWQTLTKEHQVVLSQIEDLQEKIDIESAYRHFSKTAKKLRRQKKAAGTKCSRLQYCKSLLKPRLGAAKQLLRQKEKESLVDPIEHGPEETIMLRKLFAAFHRIVHEEKLELWPDEEALLRQVEDHLDARRRSLRVKTETRNETEIGG
jgi:hypothetical protein